MIYTISDPHLSLSCDKPMDVFGRRWENYTCQLESNWKSTVTDDDTVIIPGDISWGMTLEESASDFKWLDSLPGRKIIGKGNHDYWWETFSKLEKFKAENDISTIDFLHNNAYLCENKIICGTRGWICENSLKPEDLKILNRENQRLQMSLECAKKLLEKKPDAEIIVFMHYPPAVTGTVQEIIFDTLLSYGIQRLYYGHLHGISDNAGLCRTKYGIELNLVSCDYLKFIPLKID